MSKRLSLDSPERTSSPSEISAWPAATLPGVNSKRSRGVWQDGHRTFNRACPAMVIRARTSLSPASVRSGSRRPMGKRPRHPGHRTRGSTYRSSPTECFTWAVRHCLQKRPEHLPVPQGAAMISPPQASKQMPHTGSPAALPFAHMHFTGSGRSALPPRSCSDNRHQRPMSLKTWTPSSSRLDSAAWAAARSAPAWLETPRIGRHAGGGGGGITRFPVLVRRRSGEGEAGGMASPSTFVPARPWQS
mmetsp:Transcript_63001/g.198984  ORF Transcript_63001/g.198984 Transcript_63001/m.198984 type:complete len:246 (-) Transcript_63001:523-1260(-)